MSTYSVVATLTAGQRICFFYPISDDFHRNIFGIWVLKFGYRDSFDFKLGSRLWLVCRPMIIFDDYVLMNIYASRRPGPLPIPVVWVKPMLFYLIMNPLPCPEFPSLESAEDSGWNKKNKRKKLKYNNCHTSLSLSHKLLRNEIKQRIFLFSSRK